MTKSVNKIKDIIRLNKPSFNEKYKVWVVRMKTKSGWKAVWRKEKDDSVKVYDLLLKKVLKEEEIDVNTPPTNTPSSLSSEEKVDVKQSPPVINSIVSKFLHKKDVVKK